MAEGGWIEKLQKRIGMGFNVYKFNINRHKTLNHHEIELQIYLCNGTVFLSGDFPFQFNVVSIEWFCASIFFLDHPEKV